MVLFSYTCIQCSVVFTSRKLDKKFCTKKCYHTSKRGGDIINECVVCKTTFVVPFKFRGTKTCGKACVSALRKSKITRELVNCLACGKSFEVVQSYKNSAKYCSYDPCFLSTRKSRQPDVEKTCEHCGKQFIVSFTRSNQRFCGHSCSNSGVNNGMFGKPGSMLGKTAWNNGLTSKSDERVTKLGKKISVLAKQQFLSGERTNAGVHNPMYGHTPNMLTPEQRSNYSKAAVQRVLDGVSGYKTGHVTGVYVGQKSVTPVKFKSSWELAAMMWWDRFPEVVSYAYEPDVIELGDGRRAIPDFFVTYFNGHTSYVEIKPSAIQALPNVSERLEKVKASVESNGNVYTSIGNAEIDFMKNELGKDFIDAIKFYKSRCKDVCDSESV